MSKRATTVRFDDLDGMPPAAPLSPGFTALTDEEAEKRAADDPDAGLIPPGFWDKAQPAGAENNRSVIPGLRSRTRNP